MTLLNQNMPLRIHIAATAALLIAMTSAQAQVEPQATPTPAREPNLDSVLRRITDPEYLYARYSANVTGPDSTSTDFTPVLDSIPRSVVIDDYEHVHFDADRDSIGLVAAVVRIDDDYATVALGVNESDAPHVVLADRLFRWPVSPIKGGQVEAVRDLTGDGIPDMAIVYYGGQTWQMRAYRWDGTDQLLEMRGEDDSGSLGHPFLGRFSVGLEDADGDGIPEIGVADRPGDLRYDVVHTIYKWNGESYQILKRVYAKRGSPEVKEVYPNR